MKIKNFLIVSFVLFISLSLTVEVNAQKKRVSTTKKTVGARGTLSVEAGLIFKSGDVKPVARVEFHLLDADLKDILSGANLKPEIRTNLDLITTFAFALSYQDLYQDTFQKSITAIKPHVVSSTTTDFQGKARFPAVKGGNYYLYGFTKAGNSSVLWNLNVSIKGGQNSITLDNNNAAVAF